MCQQEPVVTSQENRLTPTVNRCFLVVFLLSLFFLGRILWPFWSILVLSYLLTSLFQPVYLFGRRHLSPTPASALTCLLIFTIVFVPLTFFVFALTDEALKLYTWGRGSQLPLKLQLFVQESPQILLLQKQLQEVGLALNPEQLSEAFSYLASQGGLLLYNQASAWATNILQFFLYFSMMILIIFFLLIDQAKLTTYLLRLSPLPEDENQLLLRKFQAVAAAILKGNGICGLIQGILGGIVYSLLGISSPLLWGLVMGILAFLPIFGIGLVMIPTGLYLLLSSQVGAGLFLLIFYLFLSLSVEYLLKPKLVGSQVKIHTLLVFLSILGGLSVYGVLGIVYGPMIVTAFLTLADIYMRKYDQRHRLGHRSGKIDGDEIPASDHIPLPGHQP